MFDAISATAGNRDAREARLRGVGKSGKQWEAHIFGLDEVWRADMDGNGTQDYVLFAAGPYFNGRTTPLFSLSILLMAPDGLPVPFFTVVYHGENGAGIKHLVDLSHDGHSELLIGTYDEIASDPLVGPFCSGHWNPTRRHPRCGCRRTGSPRSRSSPPPPHRQSSCSTTRSRRLPRRCRPGSTSSNPARGRRSSCP